MRNDVSLVGAGTALLVTGSNMSGKTTLLRAIGAEHRARARRGSGVAAALDALSGLQLVTSMRVKDSLEQGVSYFYAEVRRLKPVLDAAAAHPGRALFLLDEMLLGTNTRERQIASREVLRLLLETGAIGAVTTHDLSLAELAAGAGVPRCATSTSRTCSKTGEMRFDYTPPRGRGADHQRAPGAGAGRDPGARRRPRVRGSSPRWPDWTRTHTVPRDSQQPKTSRWKAGVDFSAGGAHGEATLRFEPRFGAARWTSTPGSSRSTR